MTGNNQANFVLLPVSEMLKTALPANDHSRGQALDIPIEVAVCAGSAGYPLRRAKRPRQNHHDLPCIAL
ncbi:MAG TPA: hypothetical protein VN831_21285, partial [Bradyrhizobium sp.]|nr:hypothetical protein [Bradyrhizobium sp.]